MSSPLSHVKATAIENSEASAEATASLDPEAVPAANFPRSGKLLPGILMALVGAILFSGKAVLAKLMYRHGADAVMVITLRMLIAFPIFVGMAWWAGRGKPKLTRADYKSIALLGSTGYYFASYTDFMGLQYIGVNLERMILYLAPTLVLVMGFVMFRRKVSAKQLVAVAVSYLGVGIVFGHEMEQQSSNILLGSALVFSSALFYGIYLLYSGEAVSRIGSLRLAGWATSFACVLTLLTFVVIRPIDSIVAPAPILWFSLLNAIACTAAPVLLVMMAIERIGPTLAAQTGMVGPLSTIGFGVVLLGETFTPWLVLGTAVVVLGIWLLARWR